MSKSPARTGSETTYRGDNGHGPKPADGPAWRASRGPLMLSLLILAVGLAPLPSGRLREIRQETQSMELNRSDREATAGSYYEGLIDGGPSDWRSELTRRLLGESPDWVRFHDIHAHQDLPGDYLQYALRPRVDRAVFGSRFTTNALGLRDREYSVCKPPGTFRILLLGSSIDMGWGVGTDQTYENLLEDWLNQRSTLIGSSRRFEVINLAVAAYSPLQRLETFRRIGRSFEPDLVVYAATMLDPRLLEIHLSTLLRERIDLRDDFLRRHVAKARIRDEDLGADPASKEALKRRLRPRLWTVADETVAALREDCRDAGVPLVYLMIPRVGMADAPGVRAEPVARHQAIGTAHADWTIDLSGCFDEIDPSSLEIAPWDDHPNAKGHDLLFHALARAIAREPGLYRALFGEEP